MTMKRETLYPRWVLFLIVAILPLVACTGDPNAASSTTPSQTVSPSSPSATTTAATTTSRPRPTVPVAELGARAKQAIIAPDGLSDVGGVAQDEHGELLALTEACELQLVAEADEYASYYRFWEVDRAGYTVKNIGYAYHQTSAAEVINELAAALPSCRQWTEVDDTVRVVVPRVPVPQPEGLSQFLAFCQDSPDGSRRYACVAYLGQGNLVSRLSIARPDFGTRALDALQALVPRAAQVLIAAQGQ